VFRTARALISLTFIALSVWCAFNIKLGSRTLAQHVDRIGQTPEARELMDGTRQTVQPAVDEAHNRMFGEYIEAPTASSANAGESLPVRAATPRP
jgi:hypothetical protein